MRIVTQSITTQTIHQIVLFPHFHCIMAILYRQLDAGLGCSAATDLQEFAFKKANCLSCHVQLTDEDLVRDLMYGGQQLTAARYNNRPHSS